MRFPKRKGCVYILWGERFNEVMATIFATQLRAHGWCTQLIGLHGNQHPGRFGLVLMADLSLSQALATPEPVLCLIAPCPATLLAYGAYDPRIEELVAVANAAHALFVAETETGLPPPDAVTWPKTALAIDPDLDSVALAATTILEVLQHPNQPPS